MSEAENVALKVEETAPVDAVSEEKPVQKQQQVSLLNVRVTTENDALNMLVAFLQVAQKRGAFSLEEAGKIMESVNKFQRTAPTSSTPEPLETVPEEKV
jgi:hypothetical protein